MVYNKKHEDKTTLQSKTGSNTKPRISSYDYHAWDKFDVVRLTLKTFGHFYTETCSLL